MLLPCLYFAVTFKRSRTTLQIQKDVHALLTRNFQVMCPSALLMKVIIHVVMLEHSDRLRPVYHQILCKITPTSAEHLQNCPTPNLLSAPQRYLSISPRKI